MKNIYLICLLLLFTGVCVAQEGGTNFEELTFEEALAKAAKVDKPLFIDCYTKTCGPCKYMVKFIFPLKKCGDYFNSHYVCIMKDMEEGDGLGIARKYHVGMYPTYLILNSDGTEICRILGGVASPEEDFVKKVEEHLRLAGLNKRYADGDREESFIQEYTGFLLKMDPARLQQVMGEIWPARGVEKLCEKQNWEMIQSQLKQIDNPLFRYILKNRKAFAEILGKQTVEDKLFGCYSEEFRVFKRMALDFPGRMADLKLLEKEGCRPARPLRYCMLCRYIIDGGKKEQVDKIVKMLTKELSALPTSGERMQVIGELGGVNKVASPGQLREICDALTVLASETTPEEANYIKRLLARLSADRE